MEPNLGSKTSHFFTNRHPETSNPPKTSQDPQNLLQDPSGTPPRLLQASPKRFQSMTSKANLTKSSPFLKFWLNNITLQHSEYSLGPIHWMNFTFLYFIFVGHWFLFIRHRALRLVRDPDPQRLLSDHRTQCIGLSSFLTMSYSLDVVFLWTHPQNSK